MNETAEYLRAQMDDLNAQYEAIRAQQASQLQSRIAGIDKLAESDVNPWLAGGIAGLYGQDPLAAFTRYQQLPAMRQARKAELLDEDVDAQAKALHEMRKAVMARMTARDAAGSDVPYESKVFGDNFIVTNRRTGVPFVMGIDQTQMYTSRVKQYIDELSKVGGMDFATMQSRAHELAQRDMANANLGYRDLGGMTPKMEAGIVQPGIVPPSPELSAVPESLEKPPIVPEATVSTSGYPPNQEDQDNARKYIPIIQAELKNAKGQRRTILQGELDRLQSMASGKMPNRMPTTWSGNVPDGITPPTEQPVSVASDKGSTYVPTPAEKQMEEQQFKDYAIENKADREMMSGIRNMGPSLEVMKAILSNPKLINVGPLHEQLTELGGFMNYIDPNSQLAQSVGNTPAYFSNLMNLVRDKIKALGSGTAVSNLDLVVTQKSVGDLRNTPEGNKKLLAIIELQNATMMDRLQKKVGYFESGRQGYKGYTDFARKQGDDPTHIVRRDPNSGNYYVQARADWIAEQAKANNTTTDKVAKYWKQKANEATARLVQGTPIKFGGK